MEMILLKYGASIINENNPLQNLQRIYHVHAESNN